MNQKDRQLEIKIDLAHKSMMASTKKEDQQYHYKRMCELIASRSPAQVKRMEEAKGLVRYA